MFKKILFILLIILLGVAGGGFSWYGFGRGAIADIRGTVTTFDRNLERSEQLVSVFGVDLGRYTDTFSVRVEEAGGLRDQIGSVREEFGELRLEFGGYTSELSITRGEFIPIVNGITSVEEAVQRIVILDRDFADLLYFYRRRGEESRSEE